MATRSTVADRPPSQLLAAESDMIANLALQSEQKLPVVSAAHRPDGEEAARLLSRYPALSEIELARLINLYRRLPALDVALILSDDKLARKVDQFSKDHRSKVRIPFRQYAVFVWIAAAGLTVLAWAIVFGS